MPTGAKPKERLRANCGHLGAPHRCTGKPPGSLSVSGFTPGEQPLHLSCQLQLCPRHRALSVLAIDADALLQFSQPSWGEAGTSTTVPFFRRKLRAQEAGPLAHGCSGREGQTRYLKLWCSDAEIVQHSPGTSMASLWMLLRSWERNKPGISSTFN